MLRGCSGLLAPGVAARGQHQPWLPRDGSVSRARLALGGGTERGWAAGRGQESSEPCWDPQRSPCEGCEGPPGPGHCSGSPQSCVEPQSHKTLPSLADVAQPSPSPASGLSEVSPRCPQPLPVSLPVFQLPGPSSSWHRNSFLALAGAVPGSLCPGGAGQEGQEGRAALSLAGSIAFPRPCSLPGHSEQPSSAGSFPPGLLLFPQVQLAPAASCRFQPA